MKGILKMKAGLEGFLDVDNLRRITMEGLTEGILQSCSILLFLVSFDCVYVTHLPFI
jgi:hypothetical protein